MKKSIKDIMIITMVLILVFTSGCNKTSIGTQVEKKIIALNKPEKEGVFVEKIDELYVVRYNQDYSMKEFLEKGVSSDEELIAFFEEQGLNPYKNMLDVMRRPFSVFCSTYSAINAEGDYIFARNLESGSDSVPILLYTTPSDGYASVSMVNGLYFGYQNTSTSTDEKPMLSVPYSPFDGMNEWGLTVASNTTEAFVNSNPDKTTISSYGAMRLMLDSAKNVEEAISIFEKYNIYFQAEAAIKFIISDASGKSVLIEYVGDEFIIIENSNPWQIATNFRVSAFENEEEPARKRVCKRYTQLFETLEETNGIISDDEAMKLLKSVAQTFASWSAIYNKSTGEIAVATKTNHKYNDVKYFKLEMKKN